MSLKARVIAAVAAALLAGCAAGGSGGIPPATQTPAFRSHAATAYAFAPYVDMSASPSYVFSVGSKQTGTLYYTMAFIVGYKTSTNAYACQGAWGGYALPTDQPFEAYVTKQLSAIRALGGDGILAFGGAGGRDLAEACSDVNSLEAAYQSIIDTYGTSHVDFDIEGTAVDDLPSVARRSTALAMLQAHYASLGTPLSISYTLPVNPTGLPGDVLDVVKSALAAGVQLDIVNVMTMDFGNAAVPHPAGHMGTIAIGAAKATARQLHGIGFPLGTNPYASIGVTPMIGENDVSAEIFEPSDANVLLAWAQKNGLGRIAFWAAQRDRECKGGPNPRASDTCSGIVQKPGTFAKILSAY